MITNQKLGQSDLVY